MFCIEKYEDPLGFGERGAQGNYACIRFIRAPQEGAHKRDIPLPAPNNHVTPEQFRDPQLETSGTIIGFYPREFYTFDNFSSFQVDYHGRRWPTSEHAYQASHIFDTAPELVEAIYEARSAHDAYKIAKANGHRAPDDWNDIKVEVMYDICKLKLLQNDYVREKLALSGDLEIVEDSTKDSFWGWGPNRDGRNELSKIWMRLRDELRAGTIVHNNPGGQVPDA